MSLNKLDKKADIISFDPFLKEKSGGRCLDCQTTALQTCCAPLHFLGKLFVLDVLYFLPLRNCSLKPHITTGSDSFTVIVKHCNLSPEGLAECAKSFITEIDFVIHHARAHFFVIYLVSFWCLRQG